MANWVQASHHDARIKFVAQVVRMFGSNIRRSYEHAPLDVCSLGWKSGNEDVHWHEAVSSSSTNVKDKLQMLGVESVEDANVCMYTCIVAVSRYKWGLRGPAASTKRVWIQEGKKLAGIDMLRLIERLPEHNDMFQEEMEKEIESILPNVTCVLCKKPIVGLRPSKIIGPCPSRCSKKCIDKEKYERKKLKRKEMMGL